MVVMAIAPVAGGVEPLEVGPPKDEVLLEVDPPPGWLCWHHYILPGLPSTPLT